jgi:hypothetical protein
MGKLGDAQGAPSRWSYRLENVTPREGGTPVNLEKIWISAFAEITTLAIIQQNKMVNLIG